MPSGIAYPEITEMQARAVFEAAADVAKMKIKVKPGSQRFRWSGSKELDLQVEIVHRVAKGSHGREEGQTQLHGGQR